MAGNQALASYAIQSSRSLISSANRLFEGFVRNLLTTGSFVRLVCSHYEFSGSVILDSCFNFEAR